MNNIEKIRQEIERRKKYESENYHDRKADGRPNEGWAESLAIMGELEELLSFIDSLPEEKPTLTVEDIKTILDLSFWNNDPEKILDEYNRLHQTKA